MAILHVAPFARLLLISDPLLFDFLGRVAKSTAHTILVFSAVLFLVEGTDSRDKQSAH